MKVHVAVGVVVREGKTFVCLRAKDTHQGGLWEFPGGKIEVAETPEQALERELEEEIGVAGIVCEPLLELNHDYGDKQVVLHVYLVTGFNGEPHGKEGQPCKWLSKVELVDHAFPAANEPIIEALQTHLQ